jgi:DNA-binding transcriptional LysR family regulator
MKRINLSRIDLNLLVVFDAIYTQGGVNKAAAALCLSQSAISHALGRLRRLLDDPLFIRDKNRVVPTPYARNFAVPVREALSTLEGSLQMGAGFDPKTSERLFRVAIGNELETFLLPLLLEAVVQNSQRVKLESHANDDRALEGILLNGNIDVVVGMAQLPSLQISRRHLFSDRFVVVGRPGHHLLSNQSISLPAYLDCDHIEVSTSILSTPSEDMKWVQTGSKTNARVRCQYYTSAIGMMTTSNMLLTMPEMLAQFLGLPGNYAIAPLPIMEAKVDWYMYWEEKTHNDPGNAWLRKLIEHSAQKFVGSR